MQDERRSTNSRMATVGIYVLVAAIACLALRAWSPVRVAGGSMYPALRPGDVVFVSRSTVPRVGDIALMKPRGHGMVLHRVIGRGDNGALYTKGDANAIADREEVPQRVIVGKVVAIVPVGRVIERWHRRGSLRYTLGSTE